MEARQDANSGQPTLCLKDTFVDDRISPFEFAAKAEVRLRVEAAMRQVPEPFRTVVVLRDLEGLAYEEIAEILHVRIGTVKSRLARGRSVLKKNLEDFVTAAPRVLCRANAASLEHGLEGGLREEAG